MPALLEMIHIRYYENTTYRQAKASSDLNKNSWGNTFWFLLDLVARVT
jgi:hypothetical protein